ncbi:hypothetical protein AG1IA_08475 [Rhizoctonia solani AG-1 IA]|uniref:Uncharacterized protein n=1 Tax=Thanatephorus cucumeris (strain AG1-IA) TaxID=983506 RepID=L8WMB2_THACA|nr:hypothetical protein AG1IA_08475 [Rhizoctonia solani AG-1 IA]
MILFMGNDEHQERQENVKDAQVRPTAVVVARRKEGLDVLLEYKRRGGATAACPTADEEDPGG